MTMSPLAKPELSGVHMTAIGAAAMRAAHRIQAGEPKIFVDAYALALAGLTDDQALAFAQMSESVNGRYATTTWVLRSRFAEDRLAAARGRVGQYVILGAGLDSFALRDATALRDLAVFEVDDPPMQAWKQARLKALGLVPSATLHFVPCDFERTTLEQALAAHGFHAVTASFVSWLGVSQYLSREAIAQTLRWAAGLPPGSEIVLTFVVPSAQADDIKAQMAERGIAFATFFTPDEISQVLKAAGFRQIDHLTPDRANEVYFAGRTDGLRAPTIERLVAASVA